MWEFLRSLLRNNPGIRPRIYVGNNRGAKWYAASVMKTDTEYRDHATNMRRYAACHEMVALTANYAGSTGGSVSAGKSALWDEQGNLVVQANSNGEALVVVRRDAGGWHGAVITL